MRASGRLLPAVVVVVLGAACAAPAPTPFSAPERATLTPASSAAATAESRPDSPAPVRSAGTDGTRSLGELGETLTIHALDPSTSASILEFASTGRSVIFSANLAPDAARDAAPDLWRVVEGSVEPELVWRNPARSHALPRIAGEGEVIAFVDMPVTGERAWNLWLLPAEGAEPVLLDSHPGDADVSGLVPSVDVTESQVAWTAFDAGPSGPVSQLLVASAPNWTPRVIAERDAAAAELWLPSLWGGNLVYTEVVYAPDRESDERFVYLASSLDGSGARRLDGSGLATMPQLADDVVIWKEGTPGFSMFNWGHLVRHDLLSGRTEDLDLGPQDSVNYPSAGSRFVAWHPYDNTSFDVYDLVRGETRTIERYPPAGNESVMRAHVSGDLLAWQYVRTEASGPSTAEIRYAVLPHAREP